MGESAEAERKALLQILLVYLGLAEAYSMCTLVSLWLADSFYILLLVTEITAPFIFQRKLFIASAFGCSVLFGWLLQGLWFYVFGSVFAFGLFGLFSSLLATILIHVWMDSIERTTAAQVRTHREKMRVLKKIASEIKTGK